MSVVVIVVISSQLDVSSRVPELVDVASVNGMVVMNMEDVDAAVEDAKLADCDTLVVDIVFERAMLSSEVLKPVDLAELLSLLSYVAAPEDRCVLMDTVMEEVEPNVRSDVVAIVERRGDTAVV